RLALWWDVIVWVQHIVQRYGQLERDDDRDRDVDLLLFHHAGDRRDLHSFPTRRSSDLDGTVELDLGSDSGKRKPASHEFPACAEDRKSTRSNYRHLGKSYADYC